jgi:hypothetical protein
VNRLELWVKKQGLLNVATHFADGLTSLDCGVRSWSALMGLIVESSCVKREMLED